MWRHGRTEKCGSKQALLNVEYCQPLSCLRVRIQGFLFFFLKRKAVYWCLAVHLRLTWIPLQNRWINPCVLHTRLTIKYIVIFRVGRIS